MGKWFVGSKIGMDIRYGKKKENHEPGLGVIRIQFLQQENEERY